MKICFLIGTNDIGGAEFVSYHHVLMAWRNNLDVIVISGTTGHFYDLIKAAGIRIEVVGLCPDSKTIAPFVNGCDVVFNCNAGGMMPAITQLKEKTGFRYLTILHTEINHIHEQVLKYDSYTDGYYAIHQKIVNSFAGWNGINARKFSVIPNCVDVDIINQQSGVSRDDIRRGFGFEAHDFVIGMITRIAGDKNILDALKIIRELPPNINPRLLVVGGPATNQQSQSYFKKVNQVIQGDLRLRNRVRITGNLDSEKVYQTMQAFDLGLNCSPSEGLPIALLEMMAAGIVCVMPGVGDIPEVLTGRGVVIPIRQRYEAREIFADPCYTPNELQAFIHSIRSIYIDNPLRKQFSETARQFVSKCRSLQYQEIEFMKFLSAVETTHVLSPHALSRKQIEINPNLPCVSVLMPTRDPNPEWIEQAINSIVNQSYSGQLEFVIVNHDSRLSASAKLEKLIEKNNHPDRPIIYHEIADETLQFSEVLDAGVALCTGEIIIRMDHDDIANTELITCLVNFLLENPDISVCGVQLQFFGAKQLITHHPERVTRQLAATMPNHWFVNHPGVAIRKADLLKLGGYGYTKQGWAEDYHLWCKFLKAGYVIANLPDVLVRYRVYDKEGRRPEGYHEFLANEKKGLSQTLQPHPNPPLGGGSKNALIESFAN